MPDTNTRIDKDTFVVVWLRDGCRYYIDNRHFHELIRCTRRWWWQSRWLSLHGAGDGFTVMVRVRDIVSFYLCTPDARARFSAWSDDDTDDLIERM